MIENIPAADPLTPVCVALSGSAMPLPVERVAALADGVSSGAVVLSSAEQATFHYDAELENLDFPVDFVTERQFAPPGSSARVCTVQVFLSLQGEVDVVRIHMPTFGSGQAQVGSDVPSIWSAPSSTVQLVAEVCKEPAPDAFQKAFKNPSDGFEKVLLAQGDELRPAFVRSPKVEDIKIWAIFRVACRRVLLSCSGAGGKASQRAPLFGTSR